MLLELRLKKIRAKEKKKLNKTNFYLFESIISYIQNSHLRGIEKEEILQQIIDMMLQAQTEKKSMKLIIGSDYEEFCKSIIGEYSRSKSKIYKVLSHIQGYLLWIFLILITMMIFKRITTSDSSKLVITIDQLITVNLISLFIPSARRNRRGIISITPWHQRYSIISKGLVTFGILLVIWRGFFYEIYPNPKVFKNSLPLGVTIWYLVLMFIVIVVIEIYKRIYDNRN